MCWHPPHFAMCIKPAWQQIARNIRIANSELLWIEHRGLNQIGFKLASNWERKDLSRWRKICLWHFCHPIAWDLGNPFRRPDKVLSWASGEGMTYLGSDDAETATCGVRIPLYEAGSAAASGSHKCNDVLIFCSSQLSVADSFRDKMWALLQLGKYILIWFGFLNLQCLFWMHVPILSSGTACHFGAILMNVELKLRLLAGFEMDGAVDGQVLFESASTRLQRQPVKKNGSGFCSNSNYYCIQ